MRSSPPCRLSIGGMEPAGIRSVVGALVVWFLVNPAVWAQDRPPASFEGLPSKPAPIGEIRRGPDGRIVPADKSDGRNLLPDAARDAKSDAERGAAPSPARDAKPEPRRESKASPARRSAEPAAATRIAGGLIERPKVPQAAGPEDIVGLLVRNTGSRPEPSRTITFGQVFAKGDIPRDRSLAASSKGGGLPLQVDVKTRHGDGSVRHAILTLQVPPLQGGADLAVMLSRSKTAVTTAPPTLAEALQHGYDLSVEFKLGNASGGMTTKVIKVADLLAAALKKDPSEYWLHGPLASEIRLPAEIEGNLHAYFDVRALAGGQIRTDVIVAYDGTFTLRMHNIRYDVAIRSGGKIVESYQQLNHNHHANWRRTIWSGAAPTLDVVRDVDYLIRTGAVPAFDTSVRISAAQIEQDYRKLQAADTKPMGPALNVKYMPRTGQTEGEDVGLVSNWQAKYLLSQDPHAAAVMLANADAAGSIPWHFRDEATGYWTTVDRHPKLRISDRPANGPDSLPEPMDTKETGWTADSAHLPALTYLPYLLTGDHYYLDELQAAPAWLLASLNPDFRDFGNAIINRLGYQQVRSLAWLMRDLTDAAYATPDGHPLKQYFETKLKANLEWMANEYAVKRILRAAGDLEGWIPGDNRIKEETATWQQNFAAMTFGYAAQRGYPAADNLLKWMQNYLTGLFLNADKGFDPAYGAAYELTVRHRVTQQPIATWAECFKASFGPVPKPSNANLGYPGSPGAYMGAARGALATLISQTGSPQAIEAYGVVVGITQRAGMANRYAEMAKWALAPKLANGRYLFNTNIHVTGGLGDLAFTDSSENQLLIGGPGNSTIRGGRGINLLFAGGGDNTLQAGPAGDYLFGGPGRDRLVGGSGNDYMKGGGGDNTFVFFGPHIGRDQIAGFNPSRDRLEFKRSFAANPEDVLAKARPDVSGDTTLFWSETDQIRLLGINQRQLRPSSIVIVP